MPLGRNYKNYPKGSRYLNRSLYEYGIKNPASREVLPGWGKKRMERKETEKLDATKYVGEESEIVIAEIREGEYGRFIYLETAPIPFKDGDKLPDNKPLTATRILGFQKDKNGNYYIGVDTKIDKFLRAYNVDPEKDIPSDSVGTRIKKLEGIKVKVQKNDKGFLYIA